MKATIKLQYVDQISRMVKGAVGELLKNKLEAEIFNVIVEALDLKDALWCQVECFSGGKLQIFSIVMACMQKSDVYMFDEPSNHLNVKQHLNVVRLIRSLLKSDNYVTCVEHNLSILDYLSDFIYVFNDVSGAYDPVTISSGVYEGINIFLEGQVLAENLQFFDVSLNFKLAKTVEESEEIEKLRHYKYIPI
jgi:ATP-binding cassette subfamily E protein 1